MALRKYPYKHIPWESHGKQWETTGYDWIP